MSNPTSYIFDYIDRFILLLPWQFRKARMEALARILAEEMHEIEDALYALIVERALNNAIGASLDQWGAVVGEARDGLPDETYRKFIGARILINLSNGEINRLTQILSILVGVLPIFYQPHYPAAYALEYLVPVTQTTTTPAQRAGIASRMLEATAAGVEIDTITEATHGFLSWSEVTGDEGAGWDGVWIEEIYHG